MCVTATRASTRWGTVRESRGRDSAAMRPHPAHVRGRVASAEKGGEEEEGVCNFRLQHRPRPGEEDNIGQRELSDSDIPDVGQPEEGQAQVPGKPLLETHTAAACTSCPLSRWQCCSAKWARLTARFLD